MWVIDPGRTLPSFLRCAVLIRLAATCAPCASPVPFTSRPLPVIVVTDVMTREAIVVSDLFHYFLGLTMCRSRGASAREHYPNTIFDQLPRKCLRLRDDASSTGGFSSGNFTSSSIFLLLTVCLCNSAIPRPGNTTEGPYRHAGCFESERPRPRRL